MAFSDGKQTTQERAARYLEARARPATLRVAGALLRSRDVSDLPHFPHSRPIGGTIDPHYNSPQTCRKCPENGGSQVV